MGSEVEFQPGGTSLSDDGQAKTIYIEVYRTSDEYSVISCNYHYCQLPKQEKLEIINRLQSWTVSEQRYLNGGRKWWKWWVK